MEKFLYRKRFVFYGVSLFAIIFGYAAVFRLILLELLVKTPNLVSSIIFITLLIIISFKTQINPHWQPLPGQFLAVDQAIENMMPRAPGAVERRNNETEEGASNSHGIRDSGCCRRIFLLPGAQI
jgi:hypothetical protein